MGVDATFNLGEFLVIIITYRHLLLHDISNNKSPVMIGPAIVRQTKQTATCHVVASGTIALRPNLVSDIAYGSDGEKLSPMLSLFNFKKYFT